MSLAAFVMRWGQLKDGLKPLYMLEFLSIHQVLFPGLFPGLTFDTHESRLEKTLWASHL